MNGDWEGKHWTTAALEILAMTAGLILALLIIGWITEHYLWVEPVNWTALDNLTAFY